MKITGSAYFLIVIMAVMLAVIISSLKMEYFESKLLPLTFSIVIFVLAAIRLRKELSARSKTGTTVSGDEVGREEEAREGWRGYLIIGAWVVGFFSAIYLLGFILAIALLVFFHMKTHGTRWLVAIIFTLLTPALIYTVFEFLLEVRLHQGLIFTWLGY